MPENYGKKPEKGNVIRIAWAAHRGAPASTAADAEMQIRHFLAPEDFVITNTFPDIILFMSGGSERRAIELADHGKPVLLLSICGNNAYAAATEVMAWMVNNNRMAILSDLSEAAESGLLNRWCRLACAWERLDGARAGLIGTISEWLVASGVSAQTLMSRFGISLTEIPWSGLPDYTASQPDQALMDRFNDHIPEGLDEAARVLTLFRKVINENNLDAIGVECFSLVQERKVTACLALAQLNTEGTVAACEGDLASMAGIMAGKALTGRVPWMANTTRLTGKSVILSHCTVPFDLVSDVQLLSHYETGLSLAVDGKIRETEVTLFRFSDMLDRAFISDGRIISHPRMANACRTQVEIEIDKKALQLLKDKPLGNHLLLLPGNHSEFLQLAYRYKGIETIG